MTKRQLIGYLLLVTVFAILILYAFVPLAKSFLNDYIFNPIKSIFAGTITAITTSGFWLTYVAPNNWIISAIVAGGFVFIVMQFLWPHRPTFGAKKVGYSTQKDVTSSIPVPITSQTKSTPKPIVKVEEKKEEAVVAT